MMRPILLASLVALASGCSHYHGPEGSDTATVVFTSNNVAAQPMVCVPGKGFQSTRYALSRNPFDSEAISQLNETLRKSAEVPASLPAGEPVRVGVQFRETREMGNPAPFRCNAAVRFTPQAGATYSVHFVRDGSQCGLGVSLADGTPAPDAVRAPWECR